MADLIAAKFIARKEVKAVQRIFNGECIYTPHVDRDKNWLKWTRQDLLAHISSERSFGHYLLNTDNQCKLFAFDIDLEKTGSYPADPWRAEGEPGETIEFDPRAAWRDRKHPARKWLKVQLRTIAGRLASSIHTELEIPVAAYYSGSKGLHVYGFTGLVPAHEARVGAKIVLDSMGCWESKRGDSFFMHKDQDPIMGYPNISVELFPKQDSISGEGGLGNLMRVPLGTNLKNPKDPTFFINLANTDMTVFEPVDPQWALTTSNAWGDANV